MSEQDDPRVTIDDDPATDPERADGLRSSTTTDNSRAPGVQDLGVDTLGTTVDDALGNTDPHISGDGPDSLESPAGPSARSGPATVSMTAAPSPSERPDPAPAIEVGERSETPEAGERTPYGTTTPEASPAPEVGAMTPEVGDKLATGSTPAPDRDAMTHPPMQERVPAL